MEVTGDVMRVVSVHSWGKAKALEREWEEDLPGGPGVKNPPANAEDMGSLPGLGIPHTSEQPSLCPTMTEPTL